MDTVGRRIKNERERQGLTQEELARKMGYKNRSVVSTMEAASELSLKKVKKVAAALNVDPGYLMGYPSKNSEMSSRNQHTTAFYGIFRTSEAHQSALRYSKLPTNCPQKKSGSKRLRPFSTYCLCVSEQPHYNT